MRWVVPVLVVGFLLAIGLWIGPMLWAVARVFVKPGPGACSDCHTEHEGAGRMEPTRQRFCADCHGTLDARLTDTALGNARDFGTMHPEFHVAVLPRDGVTQPQRVSQSVNPRSFPGLKFPHDVHLDPRSGVTQMSRRLGARAGFGGTLECGDCHEATADGIRRAVTERAFRAVVEHRD